MAGAVSREAILIADPHPDTGASFETFERVIDPGIWHPVPDDHWLAVADIVNSTGAIAEGRYRSVNVAGAAFICAAMNALGRRDLDFIFAGDGALLICNPGDVERCRAAAASTAAWVAREYGLDMRIALVPIGEIRRAGHDVRLSRFRPSKNAAFAMLSGGGGDWAEREMKAGRFRIPPGDNAVLPDLSGLSCRWQPFPARRGTILSLVLTPRPAVPVEGIASLVLGLLERIAATTDEAGSPIPLREPRYRPDLGGIDFEVRTIAPGLRRLLKRVQVITRMAASTFAFRTGRRLGAFDPVHYWATATRNSDYRKYADGLRMTLDCSLATAEMLEAMLRDGAAQGVADWGTHRQSAAQMTCIVPSALRDDHLHFIDGAGGGYAAATADLRRRAAARMSP